MPYLRRTRTGVRSAYGRDMTSPRTLCGDYLLALLSPETETFVVDSTHWKAGLAGAAVVEAVLAGRLRLTEEREPGVRAGRLVIVGAAVPQDDSVWSEVLRRSDGQKPKNAVGRLGGGATWRDRGGELRDAVMDDLAGEGVIEAKEHRALGLFPSPRWVLLVPGERDAVLARVGGVLDRVGTGPLDQRDASLTAVLHAVGALPKVFPSADKRWLKDRGKAVAQGSWGSEAVTKAIQDVNTAVMAGVTAAITGSIAASSG